MIHFAGSIIVVDHLMPSSWSHRHRRFACKFIIKSSIGGNRKKNTIFYKTNFLRIVIAMFLTLLNLISMVLLCKDLRSASH